MNGIFEAIRNSTSKELEELARAIWLEFDLKFNENSQTGYDGEIAEKGNVMGFLLETANGRGDEK